MKITLESTTVRISGTPDEIMEVVNKLPEGSNVTLIYPELGMSLHFSRTEDDWAGPQEEPIKLQEVFVDHPETPIYATIPAGCGLPMELAEMKESILVNTLHGLPAIGWKESWQGADSWLPLPEVKA